MKLTPLDIRHKDFKRGMRGYADVEVDEFLDEVADEYERLFKEGIDLRERVEALEEKVAGYRRIEETLQKTLISAQASSEELKQNASKEAQLILHEAELKGRQMVNEAYTERQAIEQSVAKLKSAEQDFRFKFQQLLQGYLSHIEDASVATAAAQSEQESDFTRRAEAIKAAISREGALPEPSEESRTPAQPQATPTENRVDETTQVPLSGVAAPSPPAAPATTAESTAPAQPAPGATPSTRDRAEFSGGDDLLADVDSGVNENEFKW
jgi:cell division initiation protein